MLRLRFDKWFQTYGAYIVIALAVLVIAVDKVFGPLVDVVDAQCGGCLGGLLQ